MDPEQKQMQVFVFTNASKIKHVKESIHFTLKCITNADYVHPESMAIWKGDYKCTCHQVLPFPRGLGWEWAMHHWDTVLALAHLEIEQNWTEIRITLAFWRVRKPVSTAVGNLSHQLLHELSTSLPWFTAQLALGSLILIACRGWWDLWSQLRHYWFT